MTETHELSSMGELLEDSVEVGMLASMDYERALLASNDFYVNQAGGIPRRCFLLALPPEEEGVPQAAILLSVAAVQSLEGGRDLQRLKEELATNMVDSTDAATRVRLQTIGYSCDVMGAFYVKDGGITFGADVDRVLGYSSYKVVKPRGKSLGHIASFGRGSRDEEALLDIGVVRYSETELSPDEEARVFIDVRDFIGKKTAVLGMSRSGKALHEDTLIPVPLSEKFPEGWALNRELSLGDLVYGSDGLPTPILAFTPWREEELYHVSFSDGQTVVTSGDHLWLASHSTQRYRPRRGRINGEKQERKRQRAAALDEVIQKFSPTDYISLQDLGAASGLDWRLLRKHAQADGIEAHLTHEVLLEGKMVKVYPAQEVLQAVRRRAAHQEGDNSLDCEGLVTTKEMLAKGLRGETHSGRSWNLTLASHSPEGEDIPLPLDPYILGHWLGDGRSAQGYLGADAKSLSWSPTGESAQGALLQQVEDAGHSGHTIPSDTDAASAAGLSALLKAEGLIRNKHIPAKYLRASYRQRLALLQGLMDTDGHASRTSGLVLGFSDEHLALQALELVRSLGIKAEIKTTKAGGPTPRGSKQCKDTYSISFTTEIPCFRLPRKLARQESFKAPAPARLLYVDSIEVKGRGRVRCLTVDAPDGLHLVEGFIPTHNSNSIKVIVQQVFNYSLSKKKRIGQVIFDPQGEYANANVQDGGALANLGTGNDVVIYKTAAKSDSGTRERPLLINFYDEENGELVWDLMLSELRTGMSANSNYISGLTGVSMAKPDRQADQQEKIRYARRRLGFYTLMNLARMDGKLRNFYLTLPQELVEQVKHVHPEAPQATTNKGQLHVKTLEGARAVFDRLFELYETDRLENQSWHKSFKDGEMATFREQVEAYRAGRRGVTSAFMRLKELHSDDSDGDVRESVWNDLTQGKLVIVDLSRGSSNATKAISEMIVTHLMNKASERFINGLDMIPFQIVVEEAHNLFSRKNSDDGFLDPWVRLSKEAAKYEIGLLYATQEVSSVDRKILSNTASWLISHLNSKGEINELAGYYGFAAWGDHLRATETKGFTRLKTESSPYIVPVQMDKFTPNGGR